MIINQTDSRLNKKNFLTVEYLWKHLHCQLIGGKPPNKQDFFWRIKNAWRKIKIAQPLGFHAV